MMNLPLLTDTFGRTLSYLRISVTDRCNFRCVYCLPPEGIPLLPGKDILSFEEILRISSLYLKMGGERIRLTGGEPLLRRNIVDLVSGLSRLPGLKDFSLTTNGYYLEDFAGSLKEAGLQRVNISLDSLYPDRLAQLTSCREFKKIWRGIEKALDMGLRTKINVVALNGLKKEEIIAFGWMAKKYPLEVRFIEFMPLCGTGWHPEWVLPLYRVKEVVERHFSLKSLPRRREVAESYEIQDGRGRIGFIASMTEPFCHDCSRLRLTSDGKLRPCLFSNIEVDLKTQMRRGATDETLKGLLSRAVFLKPMGHGIGDVHHSSVDPQALPSIRFVGG
ncbi:MAG: cyclic pyranopterin phosphate synthase MoaA [Deltaproteobacteria bacterium RIFCSPLOWO2_02_FULL_50_16]|nr:MAG: cyclic pyranopterin phosphate synthase MoaA [Deltaproteobacteria bacterium RIFCSPLOWO2_02_FULL_50_16]OGQ67506.1 MAG: cyclic pyranopterin phosphate synthase MoaA [Deltaproteobacteria bacterium RIFCSPLOWO2_12_FULL_50_11]